MTSVVLRLLFGVWRSRFSLAGLVFILGMGSAHAFTLIGTNPNLKGWQVEKLKFVFNRASCAGYDHVQGAIEDAMDTWNKVSTSYLELELGGNTTSTTYGNPPVIYCDAAFGTGLTNGADPNYVVGGGLATFPNGTLVSGVLILNINAGADANIGNFSKKELSIIMAHELGHVFGLGHSEEEKALMYFDGSSKEDLLLSQDDMDGITYLYPRDELDGDTPFGCGTIGAGGGSALFLNRSKTTGWFYWILAFAPFVFLWRLRFYSRCHIPN